MDLSQQPGTSHQAAEEMAREARKKRKRSSNLESLIMPAGGTYEEQLLRRQNIIECSRDFGDRLQKMQRGLDTNLTLEEVIERVEGINAEELETGRELAADGTMVHKAAQIVLSKLEDVSITRQTLNVELLVEKIKEHTLAMPGEHFAMLGKKYSHLLRRTPIHSYLRPCFSLNDGPHFKEKKERVQRQRTKNTDQAVVVKGTSAQEAQQTNKSSTISAQLDHIRKVLKNVLKRTGSEYFGYYDFVIHPHDFGETVENMFHMSFLLKDGIVTLKVGKDGLPMIGFTPKEQRRLFTQNDRSQIDTTQYISRFTYQLWQTLVKRLKIAEPLITKEERK